MRLSIITINLNNFHGLEKTIKSVINQTSDDFEYIIIDGGSTDGSVNIIKKYENRITYWLSEPDHGIYHAMNKGILRAKGEYCQFLNSGDLLKSNDVTQKMLVNLSDCGILYGNMIKKLSNGKQYRDKNFDGQKPTMLTFYRGTINHSSAYIKRNLFNKYGLYDQNLQIVSDWKFYLITIGIYNESAIYCNIDVTVFDMNGISNTHTKLEKLERRRVLKEYIPANILIDYDRHSFDLEQITRIKKNKFAGWILWFVERVLFKFEKLKLKIDSNYYE
ncbi:glycosyltransferase family 2 protein [Larkinella sp. GY13]|uniref:glycosyltransferase family 2 protein n=1 Tax=Larkinella sp. GY13 TaxID=3453720 RepID=UPI003EEF55EC